MTWKKIACAYDGSEHALKAATTAAELAQKLGASLSIICVVEPYAPPVDLPGISFVDWIEPLRKAAVDMLAGLSERLMETTGVAPRTEIRVGGAANEITHYAEEIGADVVVIGSRGLGAVKRFVLGSVADRVVHHARAAVLVIH